MHIRVRLIFTLALILGLMASQVLITLDLVSHLALTSNDISKKYLNQIDSVNLINEILTKAMTLPRPLDLDELESITSIYINTFEEPLDNLTSFQEHYRLFIQEYKVNPMSNSTKQSYLNLLKDANLLRSVHILQIRTSVQISNQVATHTFYMLSIVVILVTVVGVIFGWYFARSFSKVLKELVTATIKAAQGDFSYRIHWNYPDEFGQFADSFNNLLASLQKSAELKDTFIDKPFLKK